MIVWEALDIARFVLKMPNGEEKVLHLSPEEQKNQSHFKDQTTGADLEVIEKLSLLEWFANNYKKFGCVLEFVTNKSQEGSQFVKGNKKFHLKIQIIKNKI